MCTHPMFGPDSGKGSWQGLNFMYECVRIGTSNERQQRLKNLLQVPPLAPTIFSSSQQMCSWEHSAGMTAVYQSASRPALALPTDEIAPCMDSPVVLLCGGQLLRGMQSGPSYPRKFLQCCIQLLAPPCCCTLPDGKGADSVAIGTSQEICFEAASRPLIGLRFHCKSYEGKGWRRDVDSQPLHSIASADLPSL